MKKFTIGILSIALGLFFFIFSNRGAYAETEKLATSSSQNKDYKVGEIINVGGRNYRVVPFEPGDKEYNPKDPLGLFNEKK